MLGMLALAFALRVIVPPAGVGPAEVPPVGVVAAGVVVPPAMVVVPPAGLAPAVVPAGGSSNPTSDPPRMAEPLPGYCVFSTDPIARADELLLNVYRLAPHPAVTLPRDLAWNEDPLGDQSWQHLLHSMDYIRDLLEAAARTGNSGYSDRAVALLQDWLAHNPKIDPPSHFSWNDHSTAWRGYALACTKDVLGPSDWLTAALELHGETLADPAFYVNVGNHALNQATALLEIARVLGRADWLALAGNRINTLVGVSVDAEGVSNEQSVGYQRYNWRRYTAARKRMLANGLPLAPEFSRVDRMSQFLGDATLPNGEYEMLGDTRAAGALPIPGPKPTTNVAVYRAGFLFARTGWGETRPFANEVHVSLRWGPAPYIHGHADGMALTMYGFGARLLLDSGAYSYDRDAWRGYFKSRQAHNVVTVVGLPWSSTASTTLLGHSSGDRYAYTRTRTSGYAGITQTRTVLFSTRLGYAVVDDRGIASTARMFEQLWHLAPGSRPLVVGTSVVTRTSSGNVLIRQLVGAPATSVVTGRTDPIQGWISYADKQKQAAPVVSARRHGTRVRYLTLIVPGSGTPDAKVTNVRITSTGYRFNITVGTVTEQVVVDGATASISPVE
jgi:hypothetical protein